MGLSKRTALRAGYGVMVALLIFSSLQAYRIQDAISERHFDIYRHYLQQDEAMAELRLSIWLAGNNVRDFFINTRTDTAQLLKSQLRELKASSDSALKKLEQLHTFNTPQHPLQSSIRDFWAAVEPVPDTMLHKTDEEQYEFVQREIAPRRSTLYAALRELKEAEQMALQKSEAEFAEAGRAAGGRLIWLLVLSVVVGVFVARFSLRYAENLEDISERHYRDISLAKRELEQLSARLLEVEEEQRKRLAQELHDEVGQSLAILQIEITTANGQPDDRLAVMRQHLQRAREVAERTVQTVRHISLLLRPALLDDLGLVPALEWLTEDFTRRNGVTCAFSEKGVEDQLPDAVKTCVYRVVQEALHNCEKHAGASRVSVSVVRTGSALLAEIKDNGRGCVLTEKGIPERNAGLGILGMRERAARLGGSLVMESAPGRGTTVSLRIPALEPQQKPTIAAVNRVSA